MKKLKFTYKTAITLSAILITIIFLGCEPEGNKLRSGNRFKDMAYKAIKRI